MATRKTRKHLTRRVKNKKALKTRKHRGAGLGNLFKSKDAKMRDALIKRYGLNNKEKIMKDIYNGKLNTNQLKEIYETLDTLIEKHYSDSGKRLLTNNQRMNFENIYKQAKLKSMEAPKYVQTPEGYVKVSE